MIVYKQSSGISFGSNTSIYVHSSAVTMSVPSEDYVCVTCGYFERYINDGKKLDSVAQKWEKVG
jgi:hypothetical protein